MPRKKKPTEFKLLQGTFRKDRAPQNPVKAEPVDNMKPPAWLDGKAKVAFKELTEILGPLRVLTEADRMGLELLCDAYSEYRQAREKLQATPATYETVTKDGSTMFRSRPEVTQASDAWKRVRTMLAEYGLTPSSRSGVNRPADKEADPWADYMAGRKGRNAPPKD